MFGSVEDNSTRRSLEAELQRYLGAKLQLPSLQRVPTDPPSLFEELSLDDSHFLYAISQVAIGADTIFARACRDLGTPQCILLPQHADAYLAATGSDGRRDFTDEEASQALNLLQSEHVIEVRLASDAQNRAGRFEDTNRRIVESSDIVICVVKDGVNGKSGGTLHLLQLAENAGCPALEVRVANHGGRLETEVMWHQLDRFRRPELPEPLQALQLKGSDSGLPSVAEFVDVVKRHSSKTAARSRRLFQRGARIIISTHVLATICATAVLAGHKQTTHDTAALLSWSAILLLCELLLLGVGLLTHVRMEHGKPERAWALSRLLAEMNRSIHSLGRLHMPLNYLFRLRLPAGLLDLLRTLNVLHLYATRTGRPPWEEQRDAYVAHRLDDRDPIKGQIAYYRGRLTRESKRLRRAKLLFLASASTALLVAALKLSMLAGFHHVPAALEPAVASILGVLAIVLPVLAFGALSWSAAQDYSARVMIFGEMTRLLEERCAQLKAAASERQFHALVDDTELQLLGEAAEWYSRRRFTTVA